MKAAAVTESGLERAIRQDRLIVALALAVITLLSWAYLLRMAAMMNAAAMDAEMHAAMGMPEMRAWGPTEFAMLFVMWAVMMIGMMLPSAAPIILLVAGTYRRRAASAEASAPKGDRSRMLALPFVAGYLIAWTAFSAVAAMVQVILHRTALLSPSMATSSAFLSGAILLMVGAYQWLPLKQACLTRCRSPIDFLTREWREGAAGALTMGLRHGLYCVGCCWALMAMLFGAGVMNLLWVAAIALFVLVEKLVPHGARVGRLAGAALMLWGGWVLTRS